MSPADDFLNTISNLLVGREVLNRLLAGRSRPDSQTRAYSIQGLYLVAVRAFETFLEEQMLGLATGRVRWASRKNQNGSRLRHGLRLTETRPGMVKHIIRGTNDYVDFLPYERTVLFSELFFIGGRPFKDLPVGDKDALTRCQRVRNYIAHESEFAFERFMKSYRVIKPTMRVQVPKPIHYLDDEIRAGVTLFEHDLSQLVAISKFLS